MSVEKVHLLEVQTGSSKKTISELKDSVRDLKIELDRSTAGTEEAKKKSIELQQAQAELTAAMKGAIKGTGELDKSYNGLVAQMSKLKTEWRATTDEATRADLGKQINEINNQLKEMDASVGVYSRNVGNYKSAFEAFGQDGAKAIVGGIDSIKTGLGALKTAAGWLGLVVGVVMSIVSAIKQNEEAMNKLKAAIAPFEGIINAISDAVGKLAMLLVDKIVSTLGKIGDLVEGLLKKIGKLASDHGFDGVANACTTIVDKMEQAQQIGEKTLDNTKRQREIAVENAKSEAKLVELRAKYAETVEGSKEQLELAKQIDEEQQKINQRNVELAQKEYDLIKQKNAQSPSSTADLEAENDAYVKLIQAQGQLKNQVSELGQVRKKLAQNAAAAAKKEAEEAAKAEEEKNEKIKKLTEDLQKWKSKQSEEGRLEALKKEYEKQRELLAGNNDALLLLTEQYEAEKAAIEEEYRKKKEEKDKEAKEKADAERDKRYTELEESLALIDGFASSVDGTLGIVSQTINGLMGSMLDVTKSIEQGEKGWSGYAKVAATALNGVGNMLNGIAAQQDATAEEGFEMKKKYEIAAATMNMISGMVGAIAGIPQYIDMFAALNIAAPAAGIALGSSLSAMVGAMGAANIANIKKQTFGGGSSASSASVSSGMLSSIAAPVQYTSDVQGASTEVETPDNKVYVLESDITDTQNKVSTAENEARF